MIQERGSLEMCHNRMAVLRVLREAARSVRLSDGCVSKV